MKKEIETFIIEYYIMHWVYPENHILYAKFGWYKPQSIKRARCFAIEKLKFAEDIISKNNQETKNDDTIYLICIFLLTVAITALLLF